MESSVKPSSVKPHTRCECNSPDCPGSLREQTDGPRERCRDDAVRMVSMRERQECILAPLNEYDEDYVVEVPMCEPCAQWHEKNAGSR